MYTSPWTEFLTHTYENITFPQLLLRTVKTSDFRNVAVNDRQPYNSDSPNPLYTGRQLQCSDDAGDTALIKSKKVSKMGCNPILDRIALCIKNFI